MSSTPTLMGICAGATNTIALRSAAANVRVIWFPMKFLRVFVLWSGADLFSETIDLVKGLPSEKLCVPKLVTIEQKTSEERSKFAVRVQR